MRKPGCLTQNQLQVLHAALLKGEEDFSMLCDLEGCGPISRLEASFSDLAGTRFTLALSSGTAAIHAALLAAGVAHGDEVIVTSYSWPQSISPVLYAGATPVFADINPDTFNLDPISVAERISSKTRAIICVHLFGHIADMTALQQIAENCDAVLIADCAHAIGARYRGMPAGAWGDMTCFSLGRGKLISGGEGGILATNDKVLYEKAICLTQHEDRTKRIWPASQRPEIFSLNYRMHPLAAILALSDLDSMGQILEHRRKVFESFWEGLGSQDVLIPQWSLPQEEPVPYGIPFTIGNNRDREKLILKAQQKSIPLRCGPVCAPLHLRLRKSVGPQIHFHSSQLPGSCPSAEERCARRELFLLSGLDMDGISPDSAFSMGRIIRNELMADQEVRL